MNSLLVHINDQLSPHANVHMAIFYNGAIKPIYKSDGFDCSIVENGHVDIGVVTIGH